MPQHNRRSRALRAATLVTVFSIIASIVGLSAPTVAVAAQTATVTGTITAPSNAVYLSEWDRPEVAFFAATGSGREEIAVPVTYDRTTGRYTATGITAGKYKVRFTARNALATRWWGGAADFESAKTVTITAGKTLSGIDAKLTVGATISGTLRGGTRIADGEGVVTAYRKSPRGEWLEESVGVVATNGRYTVRGLRAGTYRVEMTDFISTSWGPSGQYRYWSEWYTDAFFPSKAASLALGATTARTDVDGDLDTLGGTAAWSTVSGTPAAGSTLRVSGGAWPAGIRMEYWWIIDGLYPQKPGASTLTLTSAMVGKSIRVRISGEVTPGQYRDQYVDVKGRIARASTPAIAGTAAVGQKLTATTGSWTSGTAFAYRWLADGRPIASATSSSFVPTAAQKGTKITVEVTGTRAGYATVAKTSAATSAVAAGTLTAPAPTIAGTPKVGSTLTAKAGTWTSGTSLTYRWYADGAAISGATGASLVLAAAHKGKVVTVKVTGAKPGYTSVTKTSAGTKKIVA